MKQILTIILFATSFFSYSQTPIIEWQKSFGGTSLDLAHCIAQTTDGGYIVAGGANSYDGDVIGHHGLGGFDFWIIKMNNSGIIEWQRSLGGTDPDIARAIIQTSDGGYIVTGQSSSRNGDVISYIGGYDYWIVKLNSSGIIEWQKSLGGSYDDMAYSIKQTSDNGYIIAGITNSNNYDVSGNHGGNDIWVTKLNSTGNIEWQKCLGGTQTEYGYSIQQTTDGGYIVAGTTYSADGDVTDNHGSNDCWIIKLNNTGSIEWQKGIGGSGSDIGNSIMQTHDGGYIVAGSTTSIDGDLTGINFSNNKSAYWVIKFNSTGIIEWQKCMGGSSTDNAYSIALTVDGGYIVAGESFSIDGDVTGNHGYNDYWIVKLNSSGTIEWQKSLGGMWSESASSISQTKDMGYIICGNAESNDGDVSGHHGSDLYSDYWIVKLSPEVLPITLLNFTAVLQQNKIAISWSTGNEINNKFFNIEKSKDGINFTNTGLIAATERPQIKNDYRFIDNVPYKGISFYRLKQTDKDGKYTYSKIIQVNNTAVTSFVIKPNPSTNGKFLLDLGEIKNNIIVRITDNNGREVYTQQLSSAQNITINLSKPKGIYHLQVFYDGGRETQKVVVE